MTCCMNKKCEKKDTCKRYKNTEYAEIKFANICDIENDYRWFWEKEITKDVKEPVENIEQDEVKTDTEDKTIHE